MGDGDPGYCACCRGFHLLRRVEFADDDHGDGFEGFGPAHRSIGQRARIAWLRLRGQI